MFYKADFCKNAAFFSNFFVGFLLTKPTIHGNIVFAFGTRDAFAHGEMAEWSKAPVLKTGDVKASVGSNPTLSARKSYMRKYPSGRRGSPAKGVGRQKRREGSKPSFRAKPRKPCDRKASGVFFFRCRCARQKNARADTSVRPRMTALHGRVQSYHTTICPPMQEKLSLPQQFLPNSPYYPIIPVKYLRFAPLTAGRRRCTIGAYFLEWEMVG